MSGLKRYLIVSAILMLLYLLAQFFKPKETNWTATLLREDKIPFGTYILDRQIADIFPDVIVQKTENPIYNTLKEAKPKGKSNYLIICSDLKIDKLDYKALTNFIKEGNHVFIATFNLPKVLTDSLKLRITSDFNNAKDLPIQFTNPAFAQKKGFVFDKSIAEQYFNKIDTAKAIVLGERAGKANFLQYKFGKGALFISPNPLLFTNYSLLKADGRMYVSKALSYLPEAKFLIWDEHFTRPQIEDQSPLRTIFKYSELKWAYLLSLFGLLAFVLFEIKRRQRIIPVVVAPTNTSVEFVEVVGRVYYQQRNNTDIALKKISYLLEYIRSKYRIKTLELNEEFKTSLTGRSGAQEQTVAYLCTTINRIKATKEIKDSDLIELNKIIEKFYKEDQ